MLQTNSQKKGKNKFLVNLFAAVLAAGTMGPAYKAMQDSNVDVRSVLSWQEAKKRHYIAKTCGRVLLSIEGLLFVRQVIKSHLKDETLANKALYSTPIAVYALFVARLTSVCMDALWRFVVCRASWIRTPARLVISEMIYVMLSMIIAKKILDNVSGAEYVLWMNGKGVEKFKKKFPIVVFVAYCWSLLFDRMTRASESASLRLFCRHSLQKKSPTKSTTLGFKGT